MKKKIIIGVVIIVVIMAVLSFIAINSCQPEPVEELELAIELEPKLLHYELPTFGWEDQVVTSEEPITLAEIAEILAPMTNEDGTGEINLNMTWQEIATVMDEKGIPYKVSGNWTEEDSAYSPDSRYIFVDYAIYYNSFYGIFTVAITPKGLKINDPVSRAIELYGEPDKTERHPEYDNLFFYYYNMGKLYCKATDSERTVLMQMAVGDDTVVNIDIKFLDQTNWLGADLEETFWN